MSIRNRTPSNIIGYGLYFYFLGLSFSSTVKALSFFTHNKNKSRFHLEMDKEKPNRKRFQKKRKIKEYSCIQKDETVIKAGSELIWLWVVIEPTDKEILSFKISKEKHVCGGGVNSVSSGRQVWKKSNFNRRWYLVSTSMQISKTCSPSSFSL